MTKKMIDHIGGEKLLRKLVEDFYDLIETIPEGKALRKLHLRGHGLDHVRTEQFNFLSGFLGGRRYYEEKYGHMDIKLMHAHIPISEQDAEDWLMCMDYALVKNKLDGVEIDKLRKIFRRICLLLVNDLEGWGHHKN
ncbi:cyanoglobin [Kiloniella spongiae]|uniref:Cyanoglobin n=1 Tax=Kiloniella spongiae TaxID=1489064 RepID=A0A0H2MQW6_9PROT|nr:group II truncated hemoglobin [Kiloniella spongiae]KLN59065.1 cyanoglobin [Kiloniella spongiae]